MLSWIKNQNINTLLEFGSGDGTIKLNEFCEVHSIEHNHKWVGYCTDSHYIYAPIKVYNDKNGIYKWYDIDIIRRELPSSYDLVLVDGPPGSVGRGGILHHLSFFNTNVPYVFDDTHRKAEDTLANKFAELVGRKSKKIKSKIKSFTII